MLLEGMLALAGGPLWSILPALRHGRAAFKAAVAGQARFDLAALPYDPELLAYLHAQRLAGRMLVLATAADRVVAQAVADHLGLFDAVVASDGVHNLRGDAKAAALVSRFGKGGFVYAGNDASDLAVWREAAAAVVVHAPARVAGRVRAGMPVELEVDGGPGRASALWRGVRPHHWVKNLLVFVPLVTGNGLADLHAWIGCLVMLAAFCATASAIYLVNDLLDLEADRAHPRKRLRPLASGALPLKDAALASALLLAVGLGLGLVAGAAGVIMCYAAVSLLYSLRLKRLPLVDVFVLAGLFTLRVFGGGEASGYTLSLWLLEFCSFLFLGLALMKRLQEVRGLADSGAGPSLVAGRGYRIADAPMLQVCGCSAAFAASLVLGLYVQSETVAVRFAHPGLLWAIVPSVLLWQMRLLLATSRGEMHDDPIVYAARDRVSWSIGGVMLLAMLLARG
jgi:4-hydroxybenzoate polyprenyltransferase